MTNLVINKYLPAKTSFIWLKQGFYIFREKPIHFVVLGIFYALISMLPILGSFMAPLLLARFANLTMMIERGEDVRFAQVFEDIFANKTVVRLAFLNFCLNGIILVIQIFYNNQTGHSLISKDTDILFMLAMLLPMLILQIAMWISPIICLVNPEIRPVDAMLLSIKASMYNIPTFIYYTLFLIVFTLIALLPLFLGLLVWVPVISISCYFIYCSVFTVSN